MPIIQYSREPVLRKDVVPLQEIVVLLAPIYEATFDSTTKRIRAARFAGHPSVGTRLSVKMKLTREVKILQRIL